MSNGKGSEKRTRSLRWPTLIEGRIRLVPDFIEVVRSWT